MSRRWEYHSSRADARSDAVSYADLQKNHQVTYVAGGAAQNAARAAQVSSIEQDPHGRES